MTRFPLMSSFLISFSPLHFVCNAFMHHMRQGQEQSNSLTAKEVGKTTFKVWSLRHPATKKNASKSLAKRKRKATADPTHQSNPPFLPFN